MARIIDWNFLIDLKIHGGEIGGGFHLIAKFTHLVLSESIMDTHDDLVPIDVNVSLHQWHWLCKHIVAGTNKVNIEHVVVPDNAEYSFVVVCGGSWIKLYYYSGLGVRFYHTFGLGEGEDVCLVRVELKLCWLVAFIDNVQKTISGAL